MTKIKLSIDKLLGAEGKKAMNCENCGRKIKRAYTWEGKTYGIECWKKLALPVIEAERKLREEERYQTALAKSRAIIDVLKKKDMSKIRSPFKLQFIPSVIRQVEEGRPLSQRQREIAQEIFNQTDWINYLIIRAVIDDELHLIQMYDYQFGYFGKFYRAALEELGELPPQTDWWGEPFDIRNFQAETAAG